MSFCATNLKEPDGYRFLINLPDPTLRSEPECRDYIRSMYGERCAALAICKKGSKKATKLSGSNGMANPTIRADGWTVFVPKDFRL